MSDLLTWETTAEGVHVARLNLPRPLPVLADVYAIDYGDKVELNVEAWENTDDADGEASCKLVLSCTDMADAYQLAARLVGAVVETADLVTPV